MDRHTIVITADKRQERLLSLLEGENISYAWDENSVGEEPCEKIYILPIPVTKLDRNPTVKEKLKNELIHMSMRKSIYLKVFGGAFNEEWKDFLEKYKISYWDFMELEEVVDGNAWITAEGTVAEVLSLGAYSIYGQKILVTGYGCCGEKIAKVFQKLGAKVTVVARRSKARQAARNAGFYAIAFEEMPKNLVDISTVINTVPAQVITKECIRRMPSDSIIIDIASKPGGTDFEAANRYGVKAKLALGLPGIYTTLSSALLLKNAISKYAPLQENVREDKSWIFQIII